VVSISIINERLVSGVECHIITVTYGNNGQWKEKHAPNGTVDLFKKLFRPSRPDIICAEMLEYVFNKIMEYLQSFYHVKMISKNMDQTNLTIVAILDYITVTIIGLQNEDVFPKSMLQ